MARYGQNSEDLRRESELLAQVRQRAAEAEAAEARLLGTEGNLERKYAEGAQRRRLDTTAREEQARTADQLARANEREAAAADMDAAAVRRLAEARRRAQGVGRAFSGARDPLFSQAAGLADPTTGVSQYQLRRQLGVGQGRAQALQQAIGLGIQPGNTGATRPQTRLTAAQQGVAEADAAYAAARRNYTNTINRSSATEAERLSAFNTRDAAAKQRQAANLELQSAEQQAAARDADAAAIERDRVARERSRALVPRTQAAAGPRATGPFYGQYPYAPVGREQGVTRQIAPDVGAGLGGRIYGGQGQGADAASFKNLERSRLAAAKAAQTEAAQSAYAQGIHQRAAAILSQEGLAEERLALATRASAVELGTASQQMYRHGALSAEFIQAAARGETTIRELGNQALVTVGKFGAWTVAASAVYGVVGAVHELGKGAIDARSGVDQLRRVVNDVNTDSAQQAFVDLSRQFNVPIDTASDAVYRMGQVFHNQADAVDAARAALYSYKTGEVDVATSTQNLIAITRGFGLSSHDLLSVYDQINQAQNVFGIRIGDTEAGLAKAGGTYRNAGGDLNFLLGLFVAIQKATGRSGQEIGTGIARAVNQIRRPSNQQALRAQGVSVDPENLQSTIQSALAVARSGHGDLQQIASGLLGNQYARLIAPVLRDQTTLNKALKDTSPEASKNSAQRELSHTLAQVDEKIHSLGFGLQRLGAELSRAGAFTVFGGLLNLLTGTVSVAEHLVQVFNLIPEPLRSAVSLLGEMAVVMRLMRRFGALEGLSQRAPGLQFLGRPDDALKARAVADARTAETAARTFREQAATGAYRAQATAEVAGARLASYQSDYRQRGIGNLPEGDERRLAADERMVELENAQRAAASRAVAAADEANAARMMLVRAEAQTAELKGMEAAQVRAQVGAGLPIRTTHDIARGGAYAGMATTGLARDIEQMGRAGDLSATPAARTGLGADILGLHGVDVGATSVQRSVSLNKTLRDRINAQAQAVRTWGAEQNRLGVAARAGSVAAARSLQLGGAAIGGLQSASTRLAGLPGEIGGLMKALGPLDLAFIGIPLAIAGGSMLADHFKKQGAAADRLGAQPGSYAAYQSQVEAARSHVTDPGTVGEAARSEYVAAARLAQIQARQRATARPVTGQFYGQITKQMQEDMNARSQGLISLGEFDRRMRNHAVELQTMQNATSQNVSEGRAALAAMRRQGSDPTNLARRFDQAGIPELQGWMKVTGAALTSAGGVGNTFRLQEYTAEYRNMVRQTAGSTDPKVLDQFFQAQSEYYSALEQNADNELQLALSRASSESQRRAAFTQYQQRINAIPQASQQQLDKDTTGLASARQQQAADRALAAGPPAWRPKDIHARMRSDDAAVEGYTKKVNDDRKSLMSDYAERDKATQKAKDDAYQDRSTGRDITLAYAQSKTADPYRQASLAADEARKGVHDATATYGRGSRQWDQAITKYNQAVQQRGQALVQRVQADNSVAQARAAATGDPVVIAREAATSAHRVLDALRRSGGDPTAIAQALAEVITTDTGVKDALEQRTLQFAQLAMQLSQAKDEHDPAAQARDLRGYALKELGSHKKETRLQGLIDLQTANNQAEDAAMATEQARYTYLEALTDDPVKQANLELQAARKNIRGKHGAERYQALADVQTKQRALLSARVQASEDNIDFDVEMGKITQDQAVSQLQQLLHMHGLTQKMRRDIQLKIKQMQDQANQEASGFDLAVGDIKLPTIYDVRRALAPIKQAAGPTARTTVNAQVNVTVEDPAAASKVYDAIDSTLATSVQATMRNAGLI